jgi:hypothetical protein
MAKTHDMQKVFDSCLYFPNFVQRASINAANRKPTFSSCSLTTRFAVSTYACERRTFSFPILS